MREPMTPTDRIILVCIYAASAAVSIAIIWATYTIAVPWIADQLQKQIDGQYDAYTWTTGIIQDGVEPVKLVRNGYTLYVWE